MRILEVKIMRGPNFWSVKEKRLVTLLVDLEAYDGIEVSNIESFEERLNNKLPGLKRRIYMPLNISLNGQAGKYTLLDYAGFIALELQILSGLDVHFTTNRFMGKPGLYNLAFSYITENAGKHAGTAAVMLINSILKNEDFDLDGEIEKIRRLYFREYPGPSTNALVLEAESRGIPWFWLNGHSVIQFGYGARQKRIKATITGQTSSIAVDIAGDKDDTKHLLNSFNIPIPKGTLVYNRHDLKKAVDDIGYPLVIKPLDGNQGKGATINVTDWKCALTGLLAARKYSKAIIVERYITGKDYRLLVINNKLVAAALRTPAMVTGNGKSTIQQLVDTINKDPRRGAGHTKELTRIIIDETSHRILREKQLTLDSILPAGQVLYLKDTANLSTGGTAEDVTELVHPENKFLAEQIAQIIGLDICGIDVMTTDISIPLKENGGAVLEVNAAPGFRMHTNPTEGKARNVAAPVLDMLFPDSNAFSIPIVAVTGTNGKTTTTRLIAHIAKEAGFFAGYTNTDGIYVDQHMMDKGDSSGPGSAEKILKNPSVNFAVLECARGGILRAGLGFHNCHVAVVTNITSDHLGMGGINTLDDLAKVKAVVPQTAVKNGYAVLNADDPLCLKIREGLNCKIALFSMDSFKPEILEHCKNGGLAAVMENDWINILDGNNKIPIEIAANIPVTFDGRAIFMIENIMAALLAAYTSGISIPDIKKSLQTFQLTPDQAPGRMNFFKLDELEILIDYAHNPGGMEAVSKFIKRLEAGIKIGVISAVGDRRDEDIIEVGRIAGETFDHIIIRQDKDMRGRTEKETIELLTKGILKTNTGVHIQLIPDEKEAIRFAINTAAKGAFITFFSEKVDVTIAEVKQIIKERKKLVV